MKKRFLSLLMVLCLAATMVPGAFAADASGLQKLIDDAGNVVTLQQSYVITDTVTINKPLTINGNGHTITYNGGGSAVKVNAEAPVRFNNLKIDAKANGAYAIDLTSKQPNLYLDSCVISVDTRGVNMYPAGGCTGGKLTLDKTTIQNSDVTGSYADNTTVGDTRGIALFDVKNSTITLTDSHIYGFGYSINTSAPQGSDGTRPASNTFDITNTDIWGWSAFNVWTVGNIFNITNSNLRGINPLTTDWNSFSTIVINDDIYGSNPQVSGIQPNKFNIYGGFISAIKTSNSEFVNQTLFSLDNQAYSEFSFDKYDFEEVVLFCQEPFSAFTANEYSGLTEEKLTQWATTSGKLILHEDDPVVYNWELLAPGVIVPGFQEARSYSETEIASIVPAAHEGGDNL